MNINATSNSPLVSVIIPIYNGEKYIRRSVRSVQGQKGNIALEIILVDDGSKDSSWQIMNDLQIEDGRIKIFQQKNKGQASARNIGIKYAQGEYVAFLDVDDVWLPNKLCEQILLFRKNPNLALVYNNIGIISDETGKKNIDSFSIIRPHHGSVYIALITEGCFISTIAALIPKFILNEVGGFNESYSCKFIEDYELWIRIAKNRYIDYVPKILSLYMRHKGSSSQAKVKTAINVLRMCWNLPIDASVGFSRLKKMRALIRHFIVLIMYLLRADKLLIRF